MCMSDTYIQALQVRIFNMASAKHDITQDGAILAGRVRQSEGHMTYFKEFLFFS